MAHACASSRWPEQVARSGGPIKWLGNWFKHVAGAGEPSKRLEQVRLQHEAWSLDPIPCGCGCGCVVCSVVLGAAYDVLNKCYEVWVERKRGWVRASSLRSRAHIVCTP